MALVPTGPGPGSGSGSGSGSGLGMMVEEEDYDAADSFPLPARIIGIQFSILSPEEIRRNSVVEIKTRDTYINGKPVIGGLFDPRMGPLDPGSICPTDGLSYIDTPGYFGHIELPRPVFFIQHIKEILKLLRCVCFKCGKILLNKKEHAHILNWTGEERFKYVCEKSTSVKRCGEMTMDGCGRPKPLKIKIEGMASIHAMFTVTTKTPNAMPVEEESLGQQPHTEIGVDGEDGDGDGDDDELDSYIQAGEAMDTGVDLVEMKKKKPAGSGGGTTTTTTTTKKQTYMIKLTPEIVLSLFQRMTDEDVFFLGFHPLWSRPEWMICQVLPIAPPAVRPSVKHDAQQRSEDDLTHIYSNIIKTSNSLREKMAQAKEQQGGMDGATNNTIEMLTEILQHSIAMIANNKIKGVAPMAQRSGRPLQCIMGRINSKNGRIRGNLMGKRVDFSARSVITGDPNLAIRQLGVPLKIAKNITKPVLVNTRNVDFLTALVRRGPDEWPGAKLLERKSNGQMISLRFVNRENLVLHLGDTVHRHMMDGDMVLFNRQPSLHRMSMMGHLVKVMLKGDSFRLNVANTRCYNADFDGDEL